MSSEIFQQEEMARGKGVGKCRLTAAGSSDQELYRKAGRHHSRLQNVEYECYLYRDALPPVQQLTASGIDPADAYSWRITFDPVTMKTL